MNAYVNGFFCSVSNARDEVIINFIQHRPDPLNLTDGGKQTVVSEIAAGVIMDRDCAKKLLDLLQEMIAADEPENV